MRARPRGGPVCSKPGRGADGLEHNRRHTALTGEIAGAGAAFCTHQTLRTCLGPIIGVVDRDPARTRTGLSRGVARLRRTQYG